MAIVNSYVKLPEGIVTLFLNKQLDPENSQFLMVSLVFQPRQLPGSMLIYWRVYVFFVGFNYELIGFSSDFYGIYMVTIVRLGKIYGIFASNWLIFQPCFDFSRAMWL